jgi:glycosyltransferase involved in cell wall biosynthesis
VLETIEDGANGVLCEPGDAHVLADVLAELRSNTALRERLVRNGYETALGRFGTAAYVAGVEGILKDVAAGKRTR